MATFRTLALILVSNVAASPSDVSSQLTAHSSKIFSCKSFGIIPYNTATLTFAVSACPYSVVNFASLSSHSSKQWSAFMAWVTLGGVSTAEIALMPDAKVRGFSEEVIRFHASHPIPKLRRTIALASPVVMLSKRLNIPADDSEMRVSSSLPNSGSNWLNLPLANSSSVHSFSIALISCPTLRSPAETRLRNLTFHSSNSCCFPSNCLRFLYLSRLSHFLPPPWFFSAITFTCSVKTRRASNMAAASDIAGTRGGTNNQHRDQSIRLRYHVTVFSSERRMHSKC